ncbi:FkbM family methyltransferase [Hansschlegelia zhihuaiae]|uniref:FkbM family methyltransferase n=1 Tax=Hansschlegelia zhihuaiae TaxID=405005 RepID=A0A4Q0MI69_9HYPH|nr:FkbM family methyltransferase [Hansschlegelia zhihuaiae]RXF73250.1 FkbM family methyltransferase [Hansschlegelia zhihuaiae]
MSNSEIISALLGAADGFKPKVIFDVGANIGQSLVEYRNAFPQCGIFCFEPVDGSYEGLVKRASGDALTRIYKSALGSQAGQVVITNRRTSTANRIVVEDGRPYREGELNTTKTIDVITGDEFCRANGVDHIDFVKIDTEGYDLEVLHGFDGMLREKRIDFVQTECSFSPNNLVHVPYEKIAAQLFQYGYRLFGFFGLSRRDDSVGSIIRKGVHYGDALFVLDTTLDGAQGLQSRSADVRSSPRRPPPRLRMTRNIYGRTFTTLSPSFIRQINGRTRKAGRVRGRRSNTLRMSEPSCHPYVKSTASNPWWTRPAATFTG